MFVKCIGLFMKQYCSLYNYRILIYGTAEGLTVR